jgi:hypothetical protein
MSGKEVDISNVEFVPLTNDRVIKVSEIDVADFDTSNVNEDMYICIQTYTSKRKGDFTCKKSMFVEEIQPDYIKKKSLGRYTIIEAALTLERNAGADPDAMIDKLKSSVINGEIDVYAPEKTDRYTPDKVREYYEEVYWDDLNQWLKNNEKRITWKFPKPNSTTPSNTAKPPSKSAIWWQTDNMSNIPDSRIGSGKSVASVLILPHGFQA